MTDAQLHALVAVADHGSFTHAARHLGMSQSAVSHAVTALEGSLRAALLTRNGRGVQLTEVGERIVRHAREILQLRTLIQHEADATRGLRRGTVRVGSFGITASRSLLPPILQAYARVYADITVVVIEGSDQEVQQWLRDGKVDIGFVTLPNDEFDTHYLAQDEMLAVLPVGHALAGEQRVRPRQLSEHPFIMSTGGCEPAIYDIMKDAALDVRYHIREVHTILAMVEEGFGVSIKPTLALPDPLPAGVVSRPLEPAHPRKIGLAVTGRDHVSPACRAFLRVALATDYATAGS